MSPLLDFYESPEYFPLRHSLKAIWRADDSFLESSHDWIQWVFPLPEPSKYSSEAPLLTAEDIAAFKANPRLQWRLLHSMHRFMLFLHNNPIWLSGRNHNQLRITRMLKSLTLLGLGDHAAAALAELRLMAHAHIGDYPTAALATALDFWENALYVELEMVPQPRDPELGS